MRVPRVSRYALPLSVRVAGRFAAPDAPPRVDAVRVGELDLGPAGLGAAVQQVTDANGVPRPGVYAVMVTTSGLDPGARVEVHASALVFGTRRMARWSFIAAGEEDDDFTGHAIPELLLDPLAALSDGFDDAALDPSWTVVPEQAAIEETGEGLVIAPVDNSGTGRAWGGDERGPLLAKLVTGDFRASVDIEVGNAAGDGLPPQASVRFYLGGLIVLDPRLDRVDAVDVGIGSWNGALSAEAKSTAADQSTLYAANALSGPGTTGIDTPAFELTPAPGATRLHARLRLCRHGQVFGAHVSFDGGASWPLTQSFDRAGAPMPDEVLVGVMAYSAFANPSDFRAVFTGFSLQTLGPGFAASCI